MLKRLVVVLIALLSLSWSFQNGGNASAPNPPTPSMGDVYVYIAGGAQFVSQSNVVNVDTLRILQITTNVHFVLPGDSMQVTMTVRNTGVLPRTITTATIKMYTLDFPSIPLADTPADYLVPNGPAGIFNGHTQNPGLLVPAGTIATISFTITATTNATAFAAWGANPLILDGYVFAGNPPYDDNWWNVSLFTGLYQYAADVTADWDTSGLPYVSSIVVSPNPAKAGVVTITVNFSETMNTALPPDIGFVVNTNTFNFVAAGGWQPNNRTWVGNYTIPSGMSGTYDGLATVIAVQATDNAGFVMTPSYNVGTFNIDTIIPTATNICSTSANIGLNLPIQFVATEALSPTPTMVLNIQGGITSAVNFTSNIGGITWNGSVLIPPAAMPALGTVATFSIPVGFEYSDLAGNTNNVILGVITVNILEAVPVIVTVNFDAVPAYSVMNISPEPYISVFVEDYKAVGINQSSIRVSMDGALVYSGPVSLYQVAATPYNVYRFDFNLEGLTLGNHFFEFGLSDSNGIAAIPYVVTVNVFSREFELVREPIPFPNPFSPNGDGNRDTTEIVYELSRSADVYLYIYDLNGDLVWKRYIGKGNEGAHAGVNRVVWDGAASFSGGGTLPNGIYICHIVIDQDGQKKSLGRTKIFILN